MKKNLCSLSVYLMLAVGGIQAGTVQQNLGFDPDGSFVIKQENSVAVSTAWNYATNNRVVLGQSFSLTDETVLRAVTLVKGSDWTFTSGTNDLYLWVGEYSTNNTVVSTNLLETFDLTGITFTNDSYFSLNLDADLVLPAGGYAFQFWMEEGAGNKLTVKTGEGYADGGFLRGANPATIPMNAAAAAVQDLTFALQSEAVGVITNVAPKADNQNVSTVPNQDLAITLTGIDPDGVTPLIYTVVDSPTNGVLSGTASDLIYTPDTDFQGGDRLTFTVNDGVYSSDAATVFITVTNIPPTAGGQSVGTTAYTPVAITLYGNDPEGSNITYMVVNSPSNGVLNGTAPDLTYTPDAGYTGNDLFTFTVNDGVQDSEAATVSISVIPAGTLVSFSGLSADLVFSNNLLNVGGLTNGLALSGISIDGGYVYSVSYSDMDLDGDSLNDTLSYDVRVSAVSGSTPAMSPTLGGASVILGTGAETVGDGAGDSYSFTPTGSAWITGSAAQGMLVGDTLIYTVENISVSGTAASLDASFVGFSGLVLDERSGHTHETILGVGAGLNGYTWNGPSLPITDLSMNPLYVTQASTAGASFRYGVATVDFIFTISNSAPPTSVGDISISVVSSGSQIALSWETVGGFHYGVLATDNVVYGPWSPAVTGVLGTGGEVSVTNDVTESPLFYRAYLDE